MKEKPKRDARDEKDTETRFLPCGVAWKMKNKDGFTADLDFALPEGARIAILPRTPKEDRDR